MVKKWILGCPFCGEEPTIQPWHGGGRNKKMISCDNIDCRVAPQVTGESLDEAVTRWNYRVPSSKNYAVKRTPTRKVSRTSTRRRADK